jgi:uncharacterized alkaline shock family protein YloU
MEYQNSQPNAGPAAGQHDAGQHVASLAAGQPLAGAVVSPTDATSAPAGTGRTVISETAVAKVAGIAARSVPGVYSLGSGPSRALGAIRDAVGNVDHAAGVRVEVGETQVAVDIDLVAVYGTPLHALADQIRAAVYSAVEELVGLEVIEVNIEINDVYVPGPAKPAASAEARPVREAIQ